jgi:cytochrome c-type biogenesis protein CcmH
MRNHALCRPRLASLLVVSIAATLVAGCPKKDDAPKAAGLAPSATGPAPAAPAAPAAPGVPPAAPAAGAAPEGAGQTITGTITLAPARKADVSPSDVVYLVARRMPDSPGTRGSLVAVKRFTAASFPIEFSLGEADMMFKNGAFAGELQLAARVDKDGDPITRKKGDVFGTLDRVKVGAKGVEVKLTELQKEDESLTGAPPTGAPSGHP